MIAATPSTSFFEVIGPVTLVAILLVFSIMLIIAPIMCWHHLACIHKLLKRHIADSPSRPMSTVHPVLPITPPAPRDSGETTGWRVTGVAFDGRKVALKVAASSSEDARLRVARQLAEVHKIEPVH